MKQFAVLYRAAGGEGGAGMQAPEGEASQGQITREQTVQEAGVREERTFTQADVDRIVQQTIARERKRSDAAVATARTEAERLAGMSAEQRLEHERQERERTLAEREATVQRRELRAQALETLAQRGLPRELAGVLSYESAEACNESIANAEKAFRAAVKRGVDERMKGVPPKSGTGETESTLLSQMRVAAGLKK